MKRRHIAMIAPPWYPIPPSGYGGIELVVYLLVNALRARGIDVTLYGCEGSQPGTVELAPPEWSADLGRFNGEIREITYAARVLEHIQNGPPVDLIHDHAGWASLLSNPLSNIAPVVHTVHGPLYEPQITLYNELGKRAGLVAISDAQRAAAPKLNWVGTVHNAVDTKELWTATAEDKEPFLLCLARITPDKGQHIAIEIAKRTGFRLILAGKVGELEVEQLYFDQQIRPHIDGDQVVYYTNIAGRQKADLLAHATAQLSPICWPEPFGLVMVEAMVSGTPVLAFRQGAAPELVTHGETGFLANTTDEMVEYVKQVSSIDPAECARFARGRFSPEVMADRYADLYDSVIEADNSPIVLPTANIEGHITVQSSKHYRLDADANAAASSASI